MKMQTVLRALINAVADNTSLLIYLCDNPSTQNEYWKEKCSRRERQADKFEIYLIQKYANIVDDL